MTPLAMSHDNRAYDCLDRRLDKYVSSAVKRLVSEEVWMKNYHPSLSDCILQQWYGLPVRGWWNAAQGQVENMGPEWWAKEGDSDG